MFDQLQYSFTHHAVLSQGLMWTCFAIAVVVLLFLDLFVFNRKNEVPSFAHTLWVCVAYIGAGLLFGVFVWYEEGAKKAMEYFTGFLVEKTDSILYKGGYNKKDIRRLILLYPYKNASQLVRRIYK